MDKISRDGRVAKLLALTLLVGMIVVCSRHLGFARIVGNTSANNSAGTTPDAVCWFGEGGKASSGDITGAELCLDFNGHLVPTVTDAQNLGSSTLEFNNVYAKTITLGSGGVVNAGPSALAVLTTAQIAVRVDPIGTQFNVVSFTAGVPDTSKFALCVSTKAAITSYIYLSTVTTTNIGKICN